MCFLFTVAVHSRQVTRSKASHRLADNITIREQLTEPGAIITGFIQEMDSCAAHLMLGLRMDGSLYSFIKNPITVVGIMVYDRLAEAKTAALL